MGSRGSGKPQKVKTAGGYTWKARWTDESGKRHSKSFPIKTDATFFQREREVNIDRIKRGEAFAPTILPPKPKQCQKSFSNLCDYWTENKVPQKRSGSDDLSMIRKHLRPAFGEFSLDEISVEHVDRYRAERISLNVKTLRNHLTLFISMLNAAVDLGWLLKAPKIQKPKAGKTAFRYLKSKDEITKFLLSAKDEGEDVFALYATALYTGLRLGEMAGLKKSHVDLDRQMITVQKSFEGPTKNGGIRHVPITNVILPVLREWILKSSTDLVFANEAGHMHMPSARIFQETLHRVLDRAAFPTKIALRAGKEIVKRHIVFHDLRHTFASHWMMAGGDIFKLQKILGHESMEMTQRYSHLAPEAFAQDFSLFGTEAPGSKTAEVHHLYFPSIQK